MRIPGLVTGRVTDDDQSAVAVVVPVRLEHLALVGGHDRRALRRGNVKASVTAWRQVGIDLTEVGGDHAERGPPDVQPWRDHHSIDERIARNRVGKRCCRGRGKGGDEQRTAQQ